MGAIGVIKSKTNIHAPCWRKEAATSLFFSSSLVGHWFGFSCSNGFGRKVLEGERAGGKERGRDREGEGEAWRESSE